MQSVKQYTRAYEGSGTLFTLCDTFEIAFECEWFYTCSVCSYECILETNVLATKYTMMELDHRRSRVLQ